MVEISKDKIFKCSINGQEIDTTDLVKLHMYYEACCTAEFLMDNFDIQNEEEALKLGYEIREHMNNYNLTEDIAIDEILSEKEKEIE